MRLRDVRSIGLPVSLFLLPFGGGGCDVPPGIDVEEYLVESGAEEPFQITLLNWNTPLEPETPYVFPPGNIWWMNINVERLDGVPGSIVLSPTFDPPFPGGLGIQSANVVDPPQQPRTGGYLWSPCTTESGIYELTVTGTRTDGASASASVLLDADRVNSWPVAEFSAEKDGLTVHFTDKSHTRPCLLELEATSWSWTFGDGASSTERNPTHVYAGPGPYAVRLAAYDGNRVLASVQRQVVVTAR